MFWEQLEKGSFSMMSYRITSMVIGLFIAVTIIFLVRKDYIHVRHTIWWLVVAACSVIVGFFPETVDLVAQWFGVNYPPTFFFSVGFAAMLIKILRMDIEFSRQEREIKRLTQRLAILEKRDRAPEDS
jgi:hypothetical protein